MDYEMFKRALVDYFNKVIDGSVSIEKVNKADMGEKDALVIREEGMIATPTLYLDGPFKSYQEGMAFANVCEKILDIYENSKNTVQLEVEKLKSFDDMRGFITTKIVDAYANEKLLEKMPHERYKGIAVIYVAMVPAGDFCASCQITNELAKLWDVTVDDLTAVAVLNNAPVLSDLKEFKNAKKFITAKVINAERGKDLLETVPNKRFLDLAVTYVMVSEVNNNRIDSTVTNNMKLTWGVTEDEIDEAATKNNAPQLNDVGDVLNNFPFANEPENLMDNDRPIEFGERPMYTLSSMRHVYGASVMAYKGLLEGIAERFGCGMYILPSSVHEVILVPNCDGGAQMDAMTQKVREVNTEVVMEDEFLADHAYYYNKDTGEILYACA